MKFKEKDIVVDLRGRIGVVVSGIKTFAGIFYNVIFDGRIESVPEEELSESG